MEKLFWREPSTWIAEPVCNYSEGEWIKWLINKSLRRQGVYIAAGNLVTPDNKCIPAKAIIKYKEICPTGLIIDSQEPLLIGAISDIYQRNDHPLRPFRPDVRYSPEEKYGSQFVELESQAGFDESEPLVNVLMMLLNQLHVPVNPILPDIIKSYWSE
jgi:hypothetical protein